MKNKLLYVFAVLTFLSCHQSSTESVVKKDAGVQEWKNTFDQKLPLLGHRNWIIVVDKAFPLQNAAGMEVINTNEKMLPVLHYVLDEVSNSGHVKPIVYRDKELSFIAEDQVKGVKQFVDETNLLFKGREVQTLLHDSVFSKLDATAKLFKVLVLKTNETLPYSSVFLQLDCAYWDALNEKQLRERMRVK